MNVIKRILSLFSTKYPYGIVYMAQSSEYNAGNYLKWFWSLPNFKRVQVRGELKKTSVANLLLAFVVIGVMLQLILAIYILLSNISEESISSLVVALVLFLTYPLVWGNLIIVPMYLGKKFYIKPLEDKLFTRAKKIYSEHPGKVIAVAGSFGKTSTKELLKAVLSEDLNVAATPANKNVLRSLAAFADTLTGDEDVVIVEYGEAKPGDIETFAQLTSPDVGIITGIAPAHLEDYKTMDVLVDDFYSLTKYVDKKKLYASRQSIDLGKWNEDDFIDFSDSGLEGWKTSNITTKITGTSFTMSKAKTTINVQSLLVGKHMVGVLSLAAVLAKELGLNTKQIESATKKTKPYEHRMEPKKLDGAWLIDDTYNGNIEGVRAGLAFIKGLDAERKIYVTPGLVEQGIESESVHKEIGKLIAESGIDTAVLMKNSVTPYIEAGLEEGGFAGKVMKEDNPLLFYQNIDQFLAAGDIALMQNDWTDNYK